MIPWLRVIKTRQSPCLYDCGISKEKGHFIFRGLEFEIEAAIKNTGAVMFTDRDRSAYRNLGGDFFMDFGCQEEFGPETGLKRVVIKCVMTSEEGYDVECSITMEDLQTFFSMLRKEELHDIVLNPKVFTKISHGSSALFACVVGEMAHAIIEENGSLCFYSVQMNVLGWPASFITTFRG